MASSRKRYSREFKIKAVRLLLEGDRGLAQTARDLNINRTMLSGWRKQYLEDPEGAFVGSGRRKPQDEDMDQLRREIEELREERDILKKAVEYFAEEHLQSSASSESRHTDSG